MLAYYLHCDNVWPNSWECLGIIFSNIGVNYINLKISSSEMISSWVAMMNFTESQNQHSQFFNF
jgi:hypothetical protein